MSEKEDPKKDDLVPDEKSKTSSEGQSDETSKKKDREQKEEEKKIKEPIPLEKVNFGPTVTEGGRLCITYGRDKIMNKQVVSLIRELGIDPLIMQDENNKTKPIAQFFTEHPDISFVVVILSADDWTYPKNGKPKDALMHADQNVIFHLGFWTGRLGRDRVFALYYDQRSFRWPTEHFDVIYTPLDKSGAWKKELTQRLKACGIPLNESSL